MNAPQNSPPLILASSSPRRSELLRAAGYRFSVIPPEVDEEAGLCSNCGPVEMVADLACQKAADVVARTRSRLLAETVVVAADTVAEVNGQILGKPVDEEHARQMLVALSGKIHRVYSGLCVWPLSAEEPNTQVAVTTLRMDRLAGQQLEDYLAGGQWRGKAGAFGYQDGLDWVHILEGSESNVVGLPMDLLAEMLKDQG